MILSLLFSVIEEGVKKKVGQIASWAKASPADLLDALVKRDDSAYAYIVHKNWVGMMRVATSLLGNEGLASEVVQDTWETVSKKIESFRGESSLSSWIYKIMINRAYRIGKREAKTLPLSSFKRAAENDDESHRTIEEFLTKGTWGSPVHNWTMMDPEREAINKQGLAFLENELEKLPENQKVVVTLRDVEGIPAKEVCQLLEISEANQRILLHRGRTRLRQSLESFERKSASAARGRGGI